MSALLFALRRLRRAWRSGELLILGLALLVAVAALGTVGAFSDRVQRALEAQSGEALGADLLASSRSPLPPEFPEAVRAAGATALEYVVLPTVVEAGERSTLAAVKGVNPGYPLRGALRIADEPYAPGRAAPGIPEAGTAWVDARLWSELQLGLGASVRVGSATLRVSALLEYEPDRGSGFVDIAPRLLLNHADLAATQLIQPGSRAQYSLMVAGDEGALEAVRQLPLPTGLRLQTPQEARAEIKASLERSQLFLDLAVLAAALLSATAVALCARDHGVRLRDEVALLKCLGAQRGFIAASLTLSLLALGVVAGLAGIAVAFAAQALLAQMLAGLLDVRLPAAGAAPLLSAFATGILMLLGFALPHLLQARETPPIRVFQRSVEPATRRGAVPLAAAGAVIVLLWLQTQDVKLAAWVIGGALATAGALALVAWALVRLLGTFRRQFGTAWRFGLGNITRRRGSSIAQAVALGLALLALLLLSVSRNDLLDAWRARLKPDTPNQFLINIQPQQLEPLRAFFAGRGIEPPAVWPMARARLVALNGEPVSAESFDDPETRRWINREFNLSWTDTIGDDNEILEGEWWGASGRGQPWLSAEDYAIERLHLKLGDRVGLQIADRTIELTVTNFRKVQWDSFRPNFFLLVPPGVLDAPDSAPATWLTSFYLPPERRDTLRDLGKAFPNITAIDIGVVLNQVRAIVDRVVRAVEFLFLFSLAAGVTVLLAAIEGTRAERIREIGLLRALGARRRVVLQGLLAEYATLGLVSGLVAAIAAQGITWSLAEFVFRIPYRPLAGLWIIGAGVGAALVAGMGWLSLRGVLSTPPRQVLAG